MSREAVVESRKQEIVAKLEKGLTNCTDEEIELAKQMGDPRVRFHGEHGTIEVADVSELENLIAMGPPHFATDARKDIESTFLKHGVFVLKNEKGESVHFTMVVPEADDVLWIKYVLTREDCRRQGFAEEMLRYIITHHVKTRAHLDRVGNEGINKTLLTRLGFMPTIDDEHFEYRRPVT